MGVGPDAAGPGGTDEMDSTVASRRRKGRRPPAARGSDYARRPMASGDPKPTPASDDRGAGWQVHAALVAVAAIFGGYHVVAKLLLGGLDPFVLVALRVGMAAPILVALAARVDRVRPRLADLPHLALLGFLGVFANQLLFINGLDRTTATNASILMTSIPVFAVGVGALLGIERVGVYRTVGILLSAAGAVVMVDPFGFSVGDGTLAGNGMILGNCLCFASFLVVQRPILRRLPWRTVIAGAFVFGGSGVLAVAWPRLAATDLAALPARTWWGIAYIVIFPTVLSYSLNTWAVRRSSPSLTAAYTTFQPVATAVLAGIVLSESPDWGDAIGFLLIVSGLLVVSRRAERAAR